MSQAQDDIAADVKEQLRAGKSCPPLDLLKEEYAQGKYDYIPALNWAMIAFLHYETKAKELEKQNTMLLETLEFNRKNTHRAVK